MFSDNSGEVTEALQYAVSRVCKLEEQLPCTLKARGIEWMEKHVS